MLKAKHFFAIVATSSLCTIHLLTLGLYLFEWLSFQGLKLEFEQQDKLMAELEGQVERYRSEGNSDAADRLQQQVAMLSVSANEVVAETRHR
jgi:hypothetical protein